MAITKADLAVNPTTGFLYCPACGERYSACRLDYFTEPDDHVFKHCGRPMDLCVERKMIVSVMSTRTYTPKS